MTDQKFDTPEPLDPLEAQRQAKRWSEWASFDLKHFIEPLAAATGLSVQEVLLYLISERLGQITDMGIVMRVHVQPPEEPGEEWKSGQDRE